MFNSTHHQIVFQEVPEEVAISFCISGCDVGCKGCHSTELWDASYGAPLTKSKYLNVLTQYQNMATCVLFMGGEWQPKILISYLKLAQEKGFKTCLYTGQEEIEESIKSHLDYLKLGAYDAQFGGLENKGTNQRFLALPGHQQLNYKFIKE